MECIWNVFVPFSSGAWATPRRAAETAASRPEAARGCARRAARRAAVSEAAAWGFEAHDDGTESEPPSSAYRVASRGVTRRSGCRGPRADVERLSAARWPAWQTRKRRRSCGASARRSTSTSWSRGSARSALRSGTPCAS